MRRNGWSVRPGVAKTCHPSVMILRQNVLRTVEIEGLSDRLLVIRRLDQQKTRSFRCCPQKNYSEGCRIREDQRSWKNAVRRKRPGLTVRSASRARRSAHTQAACQKADDCLWARASKTSTDSADACFAVPGFHLTMRPSTNPFLLSTPQSIQRKGPPPSGRRAGGDPVGRSAIRKSPRVKR